MRELGEQEGFANTLEARRLEACRFHVIAHGEQDFVFSGMTEMDQSTTVEYAVGEK